MDLKEIQAKLDNVLEGFACRLKCLYPSSFLPLPSQPFVLVSCSNVRVEIIVEKGEVDGKTDDEIKAFLRQRVLDNIVGMINPLCDELEGCNAKT